MPADSTAADAVGTSATCLPALPCAVLPDASMLACPNAAAVGPPLSATEFRLESVPELNYDAQGNPAKVRWRWPAAQG